jgi:hypothetical protein
MNPAPDAELQSVGAFYHGWATEAVTNLVFKRLSEVTPQLQYRWDAFLNPPPVITEAVASPAAQQARTVTPKATARKTGGGTRRTLKKDQAKEATP